MNDNTYHCRNCGAPVTTELCPYCNSLTGLSTSNANMEYPVEECKEAKLGFWNVVFPLIFAFGFGFFGLLFPFIFILSDVSENNTLTPSFSLPVIIMCLPFAVIGIVAFIIAIKPIIRYLSLKRNGIEIEGTVYGYMDDNILLNGQPAQIVKILIDSPKGKRFILYQLGDIKKPYELNSRIKLYVYKDYFLIKENKEYLYN